MEFNADVLEDRLLARYQQAVDAGLLAWVGLIGDEEEAAKMPKRPGLAILLRRGAFSRPDGVDVVRQDGIVEWSVFAGGSNLRERGLKSGRRGPSGAHHALRIAIRYGVGFPMTDNVDLEDANGFPLELSTFNLVGMDQKAGSALYEVSLQHDWPIVEYGYE